MSTDDYTKEYTDHCEMLYSLSLLRDKWDAMRQAMIRMREQARIDGLDDMVGRLNHKLLTLNDCIRDLSQFIEGYK